MKIKRFKRLCLELLQHLLAAGIMMTVASLLLNSYIAVDSIDGPKVYRIFPIDTGLEFEESEIYQDLFRNAVSDITQLVALKGQLETDGVLNPSKNRCDRVRQRDRGRFRLRPYGGLYIGRYCQMGEVRRGIYGPFHEHDGIRELFRLLYLPGEFQAGRV